MANEEFPHKSASLSTRAKRSGSKYLPLVIPFADFLWPQRLACRQETDKHQKQAHSWQSLKMKQSLQHEAVKFTIPWEILYWSCPLLNLISQKQQTQSLSSKSQVSHAVRAAPFQPKLPLLLVPSLLPFPTVPPLYPSFLPVNMPGKSLHSDGHSS